MIHFDQECRFTHDGPYCPLSPSEEQLLFAARTDNLELFQTLVQSSSSSSSKQTVDVNVTDAFGLTPLHLAVKYQSTEVLPELLEEEVDVDPQERQNGDTPLHLAARLHDADDEETRNWIGEFLLPSSSSSSSAPENQRYQQHADGKAHVIQFLPLSCYHLA